LRRGDGVRMATVSFVDDLSKLKAPAKTEANKTVAKPAAKAPKPAANAKKIEVKKS